MESQVEFASLTLPSNDDFDQLLSELNSSSVAASNSFRDSVLNILNFVTNYQSVRQSGSAEIKLDDLTERSTLATSFLTDAFTRLENGNEEEEEESNTQKGDLALAKSILIDVIWLVGSLLEPLPPSRNPSSTSTPASSSIQYRALCHFTQALHSNDMLSTTQLQSKLEPTLLSKLQLQTKTASTVSTQSNDVFFKKLRKLNTDMYYRQKRYNLMQEESEGYTKLFNFLNGLLVLSQPSSDNGKSHNNILESQQGNKDNSNNHEDYNDESHWNLMKDHVKLQITEYIGTFDLDPNRCLDVTIDIFEYHIQSLYQQYQQQQQKQAKSSSTLNEKRWYDVLCHSPDYAYTASLLLSVISMFPKENVTHLLGFKFASYKHSTMQTASTDAKSVDDENKTGTTGVAKTTTTPTTMAHDKYTPSSLYYTTAILYSHGYVSLKALQPHLSPNLKSIQDFYIHYKNEHLTRMKKLGSVSLNSTTSDTKENGPSNTMNQDNADYCQGNQFIQLFNVMIELNLPWDDICTLLFVSKSSSSSSLEDENTTMIGAICSVYAPIGTNLCNYVHHLIDTFYYAKVQQVSIHSSSSQSSTHSSGQYSILPLQLGPTKLGLLATTTNLIQLCDMLYKPLSAIVSTSCIASDSILYCKLCRLFHTLLLEEKSKTAASNDDHNGTSNTLKARNTQILNILQQSKSVCYFLQSFIIPSLSLFPCNPAISSELWIVLSALPYQIRYAMYTLWGRNGLGKNALRSAMSTKSKFVLPMKPLKQMDSEIQTSISTKYLLKRLSKDNIRDMGKQVSKVSHNNPLVVFNLILNQIESYTNLILMMVDMFKYMGHLSLDVMGFCLLVSLGGGEKGEVRNKLKDDGVNPAQWLSSLETFAGAFYKRFTDVEIHGLLAYFLKRLHGGHTLELGVLQSLLKMTGGYGFADSGSTASLSQVQLNGRCGSLLLKRETSDFGIVEKINVNSSRRLRSALQDDACGVTTLILLSQLRTRVLYDASKNRPKQIKLIGNLYDACQRTLNTLLAFLTDGSEDIRISNSMQNEGAIARYARSLPMLNEFYENFGMSAEISWSLCRPLLRAAILMAEDVEQQKKNNVKAKNCVTDIPPYLKPYHPSSDEIKNKSLSMLPESDWKHLTPLVYQRFFTYHISDLYCPEETYKIEISRIKKEVERLTQLQKGGKDAIGMHASLLAKAAAAGGTHREIREATAFTKAHEQELERYKCSAEMLSLDLNRQKEHCKSVSEKLRSEKDNFFADLEGEDGNVLSASIFLANCVYPRCLQSVEDAMYCARFIRLLHEMDTPGFHTLQLVDAIVDAVGGALYSITEEEAGCLGIFLEMTWKLLSDWRYNECLYEKDMLGKAGSIWDKRCDENETVDDVEVTSHLPHSKFIDVYNTWHASLVTAFVGCLRSSEYMHTRTGLILLMRMVSHFPTKSTLGEKILNTLTPLQKDDNPMQDIRIMAQAYSSQLEKARNDGVWKEESKKATKERADREKKLQEERRQKAEKQLEEMNKDTEQISRQLGDTWDRRRQDRTGQQNAPPPDRTTASNQRDPRIHRDQRQSQHDRGSHPSSMQGRWERDKVGNQRPLNDQNRRRDDNRESQGQHTGDNDKGKSLQGRWENASASTDSNARNPKRARSPEPAAGKSSGGSSMERDQKRMRRDPSPHRGPRRSGRR